MRASEFVELVILQSAPGHENFDSFEQVARVRLPNSTADVVEWPKVDRLRYAPCHLDGIAVSHQGLRWALAWGG